MGKTLVIAEKPSVGRDLARVLPGAFEKHEGFLESGGHIMTWAVGHLVQLAEPDEYDPKYKKWRMADLPIVPDEFKLVVRDERSKKQYGVISKLLGAADVDRVVNACDAGREGELIFAWTFEKAGAKKPVERLWLSSMTQAAIKAALGDLRPSADFERLEEAARSRSEADWIVGMNSTRAATIRLRSSFDGAVSLGRVQTPTLAILARREEEIRAFKPEPYWLVDATFEPTAAPSRAALRGPLPRRRAAAPGDGRRGRGGRRGRPRPARRHHQARDVDEEGAAAAPVRPHLAAAGRQHALRLLRAPHARRRPAALRGAQGAHLPAHELALPDRRHGGGDQADRRARRQAVASTPAPPRTSRGSTGCRSAAWSTTPRSPTITRSSRRAPSTRVDKMSNDDRRVYDLVARRFLAVFHPDAVFENTRLETTVGEHVFRTRGRVLLEAGWRAVYGEGLDDRSAGRRGRGRRAGAAEARARRGRCRRSRWPPRRR